MHLLVDFQSTVLNVLPGNVQNQATESSVKMKTSFEIWFQFFFLLCREIDWN